MSARQRPTALGAALARGAGVLRRRGWLGTARHAVRRSEALAELAAEAAARETERVVRPSSPPTDPIPLWTEPDGVDRPTAQGVVDLAARIGVALLATGAPATEAVERTLAAARAYGLRSIHVDVTFSSLVVSYHRGPTQDPMTLMRVVPVRSPDFTRYARLRRLVDTLVQQPLPVIEARHRLDAVVRAPHPYRHWVVTAALGLLAAAAAALLGAGPLICGLSFVTSAGTAYAQFRLSRAGFAPFFTQAVGAAIPTTVATLATVVGDVGARHALSPSLIVAAGIVVLLSGLSFVGAAQDAIEGFYVTAAARFAEVLVLTLGLVLGIIAVLTVATRLGVPLVISARTVGSADGPVAWLAASVVAAMFAASSYAVGRAILVSGLAGGLAWLLAFALGTLGAGRPSSSAVSALVVGMLARLVSRRLRLPALVVTTAAILPLVPGRTIYQGIFQIVANPESAGLTEGLGSLVEAAGVGVGLAAGVTLGTSLVGLALRPRGDGPQPSAPGATVGPAA